MLEKVNKFVKLISGDRIDITEAIKTLNASPQASPKWRGREKELIIS